MRLLIADDDALNRTLLKDLVEQWGYDVIMAYNGMDALEQIKQLLDKPLIILLDWVMPGMDGISVCQKVRKLKDNHLCYVIMQTSKSKKEDIVEALDAGADEYITKPVHSKELRSRLSVGRRILEYQFIAEKLTQELTKANKELRRMAAVDGLTGIANRRHFEERLQEEWRRSCRDNTPLSIVLLDVDRFKQYNDYYGHLAGDDCLKRIAGSLAKTIYRAGDFIARYGGEEFVALLPNTDSVGAAVVAEALRCAVLDQKIPHAPTADIITISAGVATIWPQDDDGIAAFIHKADLALYQAKAAGRNRVRN